jgi:K+-transporting ATPase ATPase C chain
MYLKQLKISILATVVLTVITGLVYPLVMTGISQVLFPHQANGSLIYKDGKAVGSHLIGQPFDDPKYFWSRLSATSPQPYNASNSSGSNLGPTNPALIQEIQGRIDALKKADLPAGRQALDNHEPIPVDLVTSSASGLDPHITPAAAQYQVKRIARVRTLPESTVQDLIAKHTAGRFLGLLGEPTVNVLELNLDLDLQRMSSSL